MLVKIFPVSGIRNQPIRSRFVVIFDIFAPFTANCKIFHLTPNLNIFEYFRRFRFERAPFLFAGKLFWTSG